MRQVYVHLGVVGLLFSVTTTVWAFGAGNLTKTDDQSTAQTAKTLWTPSSGAQIVLNGCAFSGGLMTNRVKVQSGGVDVIPNQSSVASGTVTVSGGYTPIWIGTTNATLTYTSTAVSANNALTIVCWGSEQLP